MLPKPMTYKEARALCSGEEVKVYDLDCPHGFEYSANCIDCCENAPAVPTKKKECAMNAPDINVSIDNTSSGMEMNQKEYLRERVYDTWNRKYSKLESQFHTKEDPAPRTLQEFLQRIKDGKWTTDNEKDMTRKCYHPVGYIRWRDPATPADEAGFEAASAILSKEFQDIKDSIVIKTPAEGLSELRTWENAE